MAAATKPALSDPQDEKIVLPNDITSSGGSIVYTTSPLFIAEARWWGRWAAWQTRRRRTSLEIDGHWTKEWNVTCIWARERERMMREREKDVAYIVLNLTVWPDFPSIFTVLNFSVMPYRGMAIVYWISVLCTTSKCGCFPVLKILECAWALRVSARSPGLEIFRGDTI